MKGISARTVSLLKATYEEVTCQVRVGEELSSPFRVMRGLRQGCVLSPTLFSLYINSLTEELRSKGVGVTCGERPVPALLYADDMVILADDEAALSKGLETLGGVV